MEAKAMEQVAVDENEWTLVQSAGIRSTPRMRVEQILTRDGAQKP
jgi:hypothetical protein